MRRYRVAILGGDIEEDRIIRARGAREAAEILVNPIIGDIARDMQSHEYIRLRIVVAHEGARFFDSGTLASEDLALASDIAEYAVFYDAALPGSGAHWRVEREFVAGFPVD